ncbi:MAG TPA: zinc ABC transporter substrate-binding protein [Saprospiraceae bacterium]|nr:zinc ABC transporter substrate-binding protein [Saprospiraceae bacterium]
MKILSFCLLLLGLSLSASAKPKVLATASMWADMARVLGGDLVEVDMIVPIGSDPHLYEPTPNDLRKVSGADLILINGLTFEGWLEKLIQSSGTKARVLRITEGIVPITNPHFKSSTDPHAWMDAVNGITYAENIAAGLIQLDPEHESEYRFNLGVYKQQLEDLHRYILEKMNSIPEAQRILITSHDAFHYFGNRYGLQVESLIGTSTEADVQSGDFIRINQMIRDRRIPAIFIESTINPKLMEQLSKENNIRIGGQLFADSLGDENTPAGTYIGMLKSNAEVVADALRAALQPAVPDPSSTLPKNRLLLYLLIPAILLFSLLVYRLRRSK